MGKYSNDEVWADVKPIPQNEGPNPVISIAYSEDFRETMDYFRAIVQMDEKSERALKLTEDVIDTNPANYTAWYYRRLILTALNKDLQSEFEFSERCAEDFPKNYQNLMEDIGEDVELKINLKKRHHRRCIVESSNNASNELKFTEKILEDDDDSKNYHAWAHRQWALKAFSMWNEEEFSFIDRKLSEDFRNNSVWNHRHFVVKNMRNNSIESWTSEIDFAFSYIKRAPNNQSPWNYIYGCVDGFKFSDFPFLVERCEEISNKHPTCYNSLAILFDYYSSDNKLDLAKEVCQRLIDRDPIRRKYWVFRGEQLNNNNNNNN